MQSDFPKTIDIIQQGIDERLHLGAQLYVSQRGNVLADLAVGEARPGELLTSDHLMLWLSCCKPITAIAIAQLAEAMMVQLDRPVADYLPEFAANGKEAITLRHVLTHTGGFRTADTTWKPRAWDTTIEMICNARKEPNWFLGEKAGYHVDSGWYVLGEIVRRIDGRDFSEYLREAIMEPLEMDDAWVGIPLHEQAQVADRMGALFDTRDGMKELSLYTRPEVLQLCRPGGNGRGTARALGRFYEEMLGGDTLVSRETVQLFTARHREGLFDNSFQHQMDWGLGFMVDSKQYGETVPYGFGPLSSSETFGHGGNQCATAFADPAHDLAVVLLFNGQPGEPKHQARNYSAAEAIYRDLAEL